MVWNEPRAGTCTIFFGEDLARSEICFLVDSEPAGRQRILFISLQYEPAAFDSYELLPSRDWLLAGKIEHSRIAS
jgi:hypothetical protein